MAIAYPPARPSRDQLPGDRHELPLPCRSAARPAETVYENPADDPTRNPNSPLGGCCFIRHLKGQEVVRAEQHERPPGSRPRFTALVPSACVGDSRDIPPSVE